MNECKSDAYYKTLTTQKHESYLSLVGIVMQERPSKKPNIKIIQLNLFRKIGGVFSEQENAT